MRFGAWPIVLAVVVATLVVRYVPQAARGWVAVGTSVVSLVGVSFFLYLTMRRRS